LQKGIYFKGDTGTGTDSLQEACDYGTVEPDVPTIHPSIWTGAAGKKEHQKGS